MKNLLSVLLALFVCSCTTYRATWTPMQSKNVPGAVAVVEKGFIPYSWDDIKLPSKPFNGVFERYK